MRIISKFHDYYDSVQGYGFDPTIIYIRKTREIYKSILSKGFTYRRSLIYWPISNCVISHGALFFCGKQYSFIEVQIAPAKYKYIYTFEKFDAFIQKYLASNKKYLKEYKTKGRFNKYSTQHQIREYYKTHNSFEKNVKLHEEFESPIFIVYSFECSDYPNVIINPSLKNINFQIMFDPYTAFQEIDMFLSGVLQSKENKMIQISDKIRKHKHGFDEVSFRSKMKRKVTC